MPPNSAEFGTAVPLSVPPLSCVLGRFLAPSTLRASVRELAVRLGPSVARAVGNIGCPCLGAGAPRAVLYLTAIYQELDILANRINKALNVAEG